MHAEHSPAGTNPIARPNSKSNWLSQKARFWLRLFLRSQCRFSISIFGFAFFGNKSESYQDKTALSNTELLGIEDLGNGQMTCSFAETPIMSTYLLAFCVGDYDYLEDSTKGIKVRVYTPKNQSHLGKFSLHCAVKSLEFFIGQCSTDRHAPIRLCT